MWNILWYFGLQIPLGARRHCADAAVPRSGSTHVSSVDYTRDGSGRHRPMPAIAGRASAGARSQIRSRLYQLGTPCAVVRGAGQGLFQRRRVERHHHAVEGNGGRDPNRRHRRGGDRLHRHSESRGGRQRRRERENRRRELPKTALLHLHLESRRQRHRTETDGRSRAWLQHRVFPAEDLGGVHGNEQGG